jgi:hypothetical protein
MIEWAVERIFRYAGLAMSVGPWKTTQEADETMMKKRKLLRKVNTKYTIQILMDEDRQLEKVDINVRGNTTELCETVED